MYVLKDLMKYFNTLHIMEATTSKKNCFDFTYIT